MDLSFLSEAEGIMLEMEKAKRALEAAKANFETAKQKYDELLMRDDFGVPKAKLKKLLEDRIAMLFESGIMDFLDGEPKAEKKPRKPKKPKAEPTIEELVEAAEQKSDSETEA